MLRKKLCPLVSGAALLLLSGFGAAASAETPAQTAVGTAPAGPTPAVKPAAAAAPAPLAAMKDGDKIVCETVRYTGSRMPSRSCRTKRQIQLARENGMKSTEKMQRKDLSLKRQRLQ